MIVKRSKSFAAPQEQEQQPSNEQNVASSKDLLVEQMKLQRALLQTQKQRQQLQAQESRDRLRQVTTAQKIEQRKEEQEDKNNLKARKMEIDEGAKNVGLYKSKSTAVQPVSMKR